MDRHVCCDRRLHEQEAPWLMSYELEHTVLYYVIRCRLRRAVDT